VHNDDGMVGRVLTRREVVRLIGAGGAAALAAGAATTWPLGAVGVVRPTGERPVRR
jgi:hypothetical protein